MRRMRNYGMMWFPNALADLTSIAPSGEEISTGPATIVRKFCACSAYPLESRDPDPLNPAPLGEVTPPMIRPMP